MVSFSSTSDEVLREVALSLGKLPERWWLKWADRGQYFDHSGRRVQVADRKSPLKFHGKLIVRGPSHSRMNEEEEMSFKLIIRKMVAYEPGERAT